MEMKCMVVSTNKEMIPTDVVEYIRTLANIRDVSDDGDLMIVVVSSEKTDLLDEYCSTHGLELKKLPGLSF